MAIDKAQMYQFQPNQYPMASLKPLQGGASGAGAVEMPKVASAGFGAAAYSNIAAIDGELHPESRDEFRGQKLYLMA